MKALNANAEEVIINLEELIGQGAEGKVYKATSARFDIPIVAKHQQIKASFQPILDSLIASIVISAKPTSCNARIMCLQGVVINPTRAPTKKMDKIPQLKQLFFLSDELSPDELYLLYEYIEGTTLKSALHTGDKLKYCHQLLQAISFMHKRTVVHLDIKPDNIMITKEDNIKIVDLGLMCASGEKTCVRRGITPEYGAPEAFEKSDDKSLLFASDIFALGLTLYEILTEKEVFTVKTAFDFTNSEDELDLVFSKEQEKWKPFIQSLVLREPKARPSAAQA